MLARPVSNTEKEYPCIFCGGPGNIVREGGNPRIKCHSCNGMYDGLDSLEALKKGSIPEGPTEVIEQVDEVDSWVEEPMDYSPIKTKSAPVPRTPAYMFVSKDRTEHEFSTKRDFKKTALKWEQRGSYDCFELVPKKISAKIDIQ